MSSSDATLTTATSTRRAAAADGKPQVHQMFHAAAARHAASPAIVSARGTLSYRQLAARALAIGQQVRAQGAEPNTLIGLWLDDSADVVAAMFGVLQAGCAFVPLDPTEPRTRLGRQLAEVGVGTLVTDRTLLAEIPDLVAEGRAPRVLCLGPAPAPDGIDDGRFESLRMIDPDAPVAEEAEVVRSGDALAYVVFTSGSTGRPKPIGGRLKAIDHFVRWEIDLLGVEASWRFSQLVSPAFDAFLRDALVPLCAGATLVVPPDRDLVLDGARLVEWLRDERIDLVHTVPSLMRGMVGPGVPTRGLPDLRHLLLSGEPLLPIDVERWLDHHGDSAELINLYGPSETTMVKLFYRLRPEDRDRESIPIGRPMPGARAIVVDARNQICAPGTVGEILIRTPFRSLGYLGQDERTRQVFVPNPFSDNPRDIVYRTGDLGRLLDDGDIEILGRQDQQVKIHGVRVELAEIEGLLRSADGVLDVAVIDREDTPGQRYLCAYLVAPAEVATEALHARLERELPAAMVPAIFERLAELPRTLSGKIDRRALPAPSAREGAAVAPRDAFEALVMELWHELLGTRELSVHDHFFRAGGHSLLAAQLLTRLRARTGIEVPLRALFEQPTIAGLARRLRGQAPAATDQPALTRAARDPGSPGLPLSFAQQRLWLEHQLDPYSAAYNVPVGLRLEGDPDLAALLRSLDAMVARHEVLRTTFTEVDGTPLQEIAAACPVAIRVIDLASLPEAVRDAEVLALAATTARQPFDLGRGPLWRARLLRLGERSHVALFTLHHIVSDGWSAGVLVGELSALYGAQGDPAQANLPVLSVQYADFAVWQRAWLEGDVLQRELSHWERVLAGSLPALSLDLAAPRPARWSGRGAHLQWSLPADVARGLREIALQHDVTLFMTLAAALLALLHQHSGDTDIVIGTEIANRTEVELEPLIGFFVNMLVLRGDLEGNPSVGELLGRVRSAALDAYAHQHLPFDRLVEHMRPDRKGGRTPFFDVVLVLDNAHTPTLELPGLTLSALVVDELTAKFDLLLDVFESEGTLHGVWVYSTDRFDRPAIDRLTVNFTALLARLTNDPTQTLDALTGRAHPERRKSMASSDTTPSFSSFLDVEPEAVRISVEELVHRRTLDPENQLPLVIEPASEAVDLAEWAVQHRDQIEGDLASHGGILFRGFDVVSASGFERFAGAACRSLYGAYGDLPPEQEGEKLYQSTPYPPERSILFHNESSQLDCWPLKQSFFCVQPSREGGETPILDCREVYRRLDPEIRDRFERLQLMYIRTFAPGLDVPWQEFFHSDDRNEVEALCARAGTEIEWTADGLRTRRVSPAVLSHPKTGEKVFFNQIQLFHPFCLGDDVRASMGELFDEEQLPRNVRFGDGSAIPDEVMAEIGDLYDELAVAFSWQQGDILLVDNMLTAHSRRPFVGPRKIVVAMGDMVSLADLDA